MTSVDISIDGRLLVVATSLHVKIFRLRYRKGATMKVGKVELPPKISSIGAKIVKMSPDHKWLLIIRPDSTTELHRINQTKEARTLAKVSDKCIYLRRMKRSQKTGEYVHGNHGFYDRSISRVAFSADSRILAVGDLSGYIDTWVLEGHEDLTQQNVPTNGVAPPASSDDEESVSDEEQHPMIIFGQHWIRNPAASLIPRLDNTPVVLSFRPAAGLSENMGNGHAALHATRHTPNPHSHDLPNGESRLFILTSGHEMHEFDVLGGRLTDWSRKNPTSSLPPKFRILEERAMGVLWDVAKSRERIWLYGNSWLWMFDLSQELSGTSERASKPSEREGLETMAKSKKRKRKSSERMDQSQPHKPQRSKMGAGYQIPDSKLSSGIGRMVRKTEGAEVANVQWVNLDQETTQASEDDEYGQIGGSALVKLRRGLGEEPLREDILALHGEHQVNDKAAVATKSASPSQRYWSTNKYRPILGIVPLGDGLLDNDETKSEQLETGDGDGELEVALIERPIEEADLPARFYGDQEWDEQR